MRWGGEGVWEESETEKYKKSLTTYFYFLYMEEDMFCSKT